MTGAALDAVDRADIAELLALASHRGDDGRLDLLGATYVEDAELVVRGQHLHGLDEMRAFLEEVRQPGRRGVHFLSVPVIEADGADAALVLTDMAFLHRGDGGWQIAQVGRYHDRVVRTPHGWRIRRREVVFR